MSRNFLDKKILVIGSINHPLADKCVGWYSCDSVYLGDYHLIIINLQSLYESYLEDQEFHKKLGKMRAQINNIIFANTEVICITAPTINKGPYSKDKNGSYYPLTSNYHWCPIYLNFVREFGESFEEEPRKGYFRFITKWTHYLDSWSLGLYEFQQKGRVDIDFSFLLKNLAKKPIAFKITFVEYDSLYAPGRPKDPIYSHQILFLPPPTEITVQKAIDFLLQIQKGIKESPLPEWANNISISGEDKLKKKISKVETLLKKCEAKLNEYKEKLEDLTKFKRLLTTDGKELENIVEESLKFLGIEVRPGPEGKEDKIIIDPDTNSEIPVEVTGKEKSIPENKLNQLIGRLADEERIQKIKCKCQGVLIGNHYKDEPLDSNLQGRKKPFEPNVVEKAKISKICLLSTLELFKAVNAKLAGEDVTDFIKSIFNQPGEGAFSKR